MGTVLQTADDTLPLKTTTSKNGTYNTKTVPNFSYFCGLDRIRTDDPLNVSQML